MDARRSLRVLVVGGMTLVSWTASAVGQLTVGANVHVSRANGAFPHMEVIACADRAQPSTLLVGSMASVRGRYVTFLYRSGDGGKTWKEVLQTTATGMFGDPSCAFGSQGYAYYAVIAKGSGVAAVPAPSALSVWVYTSRDSGQTWSSEPARQVGVDRPFLATDQRPAGDRPYVYYSGLWISESLLGREPTKVAADDKNVETGIALFVSANHGRSFALQGTPRQGRNGDWVYGTGNSVVTASGDVITLFRVLKERFSRPYAEIGSRESTLSVLRTSAGGARTDPVVPIGVVRGSGVPALTADMSGGPFHNRVYAVAIDGASVVLFWSGDEGRSWHGPIQIRATATPSDSWTEPLVFNPAVAVSRHGVVGVAWAEGVRERNTLRNGPWVYRMAASWDGGASFKDAVDVSSDRHDAARSTDVALRTSTTRDEQGRQRGSISLDPFVGSGGHTFGLAADSDGVFHAVWTDNRTGVPQVWAAPVRAEGHLTTTNREARGPTSTVDSIADVTDHTLVEFGEITLSPQKRQISVGARIRNTSWPTLLAPLRLQVADVRSALGGITPVIQTGTPTEATDVWDLSALVPPAGLPFGEATRDTTLSFEFAGRGDLQLGRNTAAVLTMTFRVYGRRRCPVRNGEVVSGC